MDFFILVVCFVLALKLLRWLELSRLWAWAVAALATLVLGPTLVDLGRDLVAILSSPDYLVPLVLALVLLAVLGLLGQKVLRVIRDE